MIERLTIMLTESDKTLGPSGGWSWPVRRGRDTGLFEPSGGSVRRPRSPPRDGIAMLFGRHAHDDAVHEDAVPERPLRQHGLPPKAARLVRADGPFVVGERPQLDPREVVPVERVPQERRHRVDPEPA